MIKKIMRNVIYGALVLIGQGCLPPLLHREVVEGKDVEMDNMNGSNDTNDVKGINDNKEQDIFYEKEINQRRYVDQGGIDDQQFIAETIEDVIDVTKDGLIAQDIEVGKMKPYVKDPHCVALFHFDASAPYEDVCNGLSLNNYTTTEIGSKEGFGTARVFDGKAYLELPDTAVLKVKSGLTLEALVKPQLSSQSYEGKYGTIVTKEDFYEGYFLKIEEGKVSGGAMLSDGKIHAVSSEYALPTDTFTHLAFTYDGAKMRLYIDKKKVKEDVATGNIVYKTNKGVFIGLNAYENGFKGAIDEVRISDMAREF